MALVMSLLISLPIGIYSAIRQNSMGDYAGRTVAILMISIPAFWIGTLVITYPSVWWHWTPNFEYIPFIKNPLGNLAQFLLPAFIMGMVMSGTVMRMSRTMMLEVLRQDYIRTSWAKGLRERVVVTRHALKNALIPIVTIVGLQIPVLLGGNIIMEQIFALPGMGLLMIDALNRRNYPIVSGINLFTAMLVLLANLLVDVSYAYLDPRVQYR
jgi:peptide/nickel transport system permease protein